MSGVVTSVHGSRGDSVQVEMSLEGQAERDMVEIEGKTTVMRRKDENKCQMRG